MNSTGSDGKSAPFQLSKELDICLEFLAFHCSLKKLGQVLTERSKVGWNLDHVYYHKKKKQTKAFVVMSKDWRKE